MNFEPIDVRHQGVEGTLGVYLVDTDDGLALFDCGPARDVHNLVHGLGERGLGLEDIRHLLLSHIHLDHAGAAGRLVREHPALQVHVSEVGAPHLVEPERLIRSARRIYGDDLDRLFGEPSPVPAENVHVVGERVLGLDCFPAPGHASHHVCYVADDGTLYAGDAAGVRVSPNGPVRPHAPPPDVDLEGWERTFDEIERRAERLCLIHFGVVEDVAGHLAEARETLAAWAEAVREGASDEEFTALADGAVAPEDLERYTVTAPPWMSYAGLRRYWETQA